MLEIIWGLKTAAMMDVWTIEHLLSGVSVGHAVKKNNHKAKENNQRFEKKHTKKSKRKSRNSNQKANKKLTKNECESHKQ